MNEENTGRAYKYIRSRILAGEYAPGFPLRAEILSRDIGVSRTPVRDALRMLEIDGLVTNRPRQGAVVKIMSLEEYKDLCGFRLALETHAAGLAAANRTESELQEISKVLKAMEKLAELLDGGIQTDDFLNKMGKEDIRFHIGVMSAAQNALIKSEILRLHLIDRVVTNIIPLSVMLKVPLAEQRSNVARTIQEHSQIYSAVAAGDAEGARTAMKIHIEDVTNSAIFRMGEKETLEVSSELGYRE